MKWVHFRGVIGFNITHNLKLQVNAQSFLYKKAKSQLCSNDVVFLSLTGTAEPGGLRGASAPLSSIILEKNIFQLKNYCFTAFIDMR